MAAQRSIAGLFSEALWAGEGRGVRTTRRWQGVLRKLKGMKKRVVDGRERFVNSEIVLRFRVAAPEDGRTPQFGQHTMETPGLLAAVQPGQNRVHD